MTNKQNSPADAGPVERRVIRPGINVEIAKIQSWRMGKPKCPGRRGTIQRENSIAPGYWYVALAESGRAKATVELFDERDVVILPDNTDLESQT